jgi:hypothetical protein
MKTAFSLLFLLALVSATPGATSSTRVDEAPLPTNKCPEVDCDRDCEWCEYTLCDEKCDTVRCLDHDHRHMLQQELSFACAVGVATVLHLYDEVGVPYETMYATEDNTTCAVCLDIVKWIDYEVTVANKTVTELEALVEALCAVINPLSKPVCDAVVKEINEIVQWILKGVYTPTQICEKLHLCDAVATVKESPDRLQGRTRQSRATDTS